MASASHSLFFCVFFQFLILLLLSLIHNSHSCPDPISLSCLDNIDNGILRRPFSNNSVTNQCRELCDLSCQNQAPPLCEVYLKLSPSSPTSPSISLTNWVESGTFLGCLSREKDKYWVSQPGTTCRDDDTDNPPIVYGPFSDNASLPPRPPPPEGRMKFTKFYPKAENNKGTTTPARPPPPKGCMKFTKFYPKAENNKGKGREIILGTASLSVGMLLLCAILYLIRREPNEKFTHDGQSFETFLENCGSLAPNRYKYRDIKKMTNSFKEKLGEGGYGRVYKGKLLDGRLVAVKLLNQSKGNGEDFINEVASISRTNHVNVVTLLGFCCAGQNRALVYEFMANGSLEKFINDKTDNYGQLLPLETLLQVALGIARGLEYLHRGCKTRILHFDIKPHNILLDEHFCPKISDFGLAKVSQQNKRSKVSMSGARGTIGYIAPEMFCRNFGDVSHKSDVYSYGMMVLEMIGSRKRPDAKAECSSELIFPEWIYEQLEHGDDAEIDEAAPVLNEEEKTLKKKMIIVSLWCIQTVPSCRPSMSRVLQMLEGSLELIQIPPMPSLSSPPRPQLDPSGSSIVALHTESWGTS